MIKKVLLVTTLATMLGTSTAAFAATAPSTAPLTQGKIQPMYIPEEPGYYYTPLVSNEVKDQQYIEKVEVAQGTNIAVTRSISRTESTTTSVSTQVEFSAILEKLNLNVQRQYNLNQTTTVSVTWNIQSPGKW